MTKYNERAYNLMNSESLIENRLKVTERLGLLEVGEALVYSAFLLFAVSQMILTYSAVNTMEYSVIQNLCFYIKLSAAFLLALKILLFQRYTVDQMLMAAGLCFIGLLTYFVTKSMSFFFICLFISAGKGIKIKIFALLALFASLFVICFCLIGYLVGLLPDRIIVRTDSVQLRHSYGFTHPNSFGLLIAEACISFFVLRYEKIGAREALAALASILIINNISNSRTSMLSIAFGYFLFYCSSRLPKGAFRVIFGIGMTVSVIAIVVLSVLFMTDYDPSRSIDLFFNTLVDDRPRRSNWYYMHYSPSLFGQDTSLLPEVFTSGGSGGAVFNVDNSYACLYLHFGPVAFCIISIMLICYLLISCKERNWSLAFAGLVFTAVYGFSESYFINFEFNYFLLALSWLIYGYPNQDLRSSEETSIRVSINDGDVRLSASQARQCIYSESRVKTTRPEKSTLWHDSLGQSLLRTSIYNLL